MYFLPSPRDGSSSPKSEQFVFVDMSDSPGIASQRGNGPSATKPTVSFTG